MNAYAQTNCLASLWSEVCYSSVYAAQCPGLFNLVVYEVYMYLCVYVCVQVIGESFL